MHDKFYLGLGKAERNPRHLNGIIRGVDGDLL